MAETTTTGRGRVAERLDLRVDEWALKRTCVLAPYLDPQDTILELECGDGRLLAALPGREKAGVEASPSAARLAKDRGLDVRTTIEEFSGARFRRIVCGARLDTISNRAESLAILRSFLTQDGLLLLSQPVSSFDTLRAVSWRVQAEIPSQLASLLVDAGFEPRRVAFERHSCRSAGFRFADRESRQAGDRRTYWIVTPFLALIAVANPRR